MPIPTGQLDKRVSVQKPVAGVGSMGEPRQSWPELTPAWAMIDDLRGEELERGRRIEARVSTMIVTPYHPQIDPTCRIVWTTEGAGTVVFQIAAVLDWHRRHDQLRLACYVVDGDTPDGE